MMQTLTSEFVNVCKKPDAGGLLTDYREIIEAMNRSGTAALVGSLVCFVVFFSNVLLGASGIGVFIGDVAEMLMLLAASILFVIGVLAREAHETPGKA